MSNYPTGASYESHEPIESWQTSVVFDYHGFIGALSYVRDPRPFDREPLKTPSYVFSHVIDLACFGVDGIGQDSPRDERFVWFCESAYGDVHKLLRIDNKPISETELLLHPVGLF